MQSKTCRSCGSPDLFLVADFGPQPLAGEFPKAPDSETPAKRFRLDLTQCRNCGLLQVTTLPPISEVFHEDYRYSSSTVTDLVLHFAGYRDYLAKWLDPEAHVFEFGCNDGILLAQLKEAGYVCAGIDASDNVAQLAREKGLDVSTGFLTPIWAQAPERAGQFDLVTCSNVFAHIDNIQETTAAVRYLLKPGGIFMIEVHDGERLMREAQFDTIYHEHLTYYSERSLSWFVQNQGFEPLECIKTDMHGGGLRFCCRLRNSDAPAAANPPAPDLFDSDVFAEAVLTCQKHIRDLEEKFGKIDGYGAAGRSQVFINITETADSFARVFDDSAFRQNRFIVGTDIPIEPFEGKAGDVCVILAWNYAPTIAAKLRDHYKHIFTVLPKLKEW